MVMFVLQLPSSFFFFNDTATTEIYTLSLHDALPISRGADGRAALRRRSGAGRQRERDRVAQPARGGASGGRAAGGDRESTRLNSSHSLISYAVLCLKKTMLRTTILAGIP